MFRLLSFAFALLLPALALAQAAIPTDPGQADSLAVQLFTGLLSGHIGHTAAFGFALMLAVYVLRRLVTPRLPTIPGLSKVPDLAAMAFTILCGEIGAFGLAFSAGSHLTAPMAWQIASAAFVASFLTAGGYAVFKAGWNELQTATGWTWLATLDELFFPEAPVAAFKAPPKAAGIVGALLILAGVWLPGAAQAQTATATTVTTVPHRPVLIDVAGLATSCPKVATDFTSNAPEGTLDADVTACLAALQLPTSGTVGKAHWSIAAVTGFDGFSLGQSSTRKAVWTGPNAAGGGLGIDFSWKPTEHVGAVLIGAGGVQAGTGIGGLIAGAYLGWEPATDLLIALGPAVLIPLASGLPASFVLLFSPGLLIPVG